MDFLYRVAAHDEIITGFFGLALQRTMLSFSSLFWIYLLQLEGFGSFSWLSSKFSVVEALKKNTVLNLAE